MAQAVLTCPQNLATVTDLQLSSACASLNSQLSVAISNGATNAIFGATIVYPPSTEVQRTLAASPTNGFILGTQNIQPGTTYASLIATSAATAQNPFGFGVTSTRVSSNNGIGFGFGTPVTSSTRFASVTAPATGESGSNRLTVYVTTGPNGPITVTSTIGGGIAGGTANSGQVTTYTSSEPNGFTVVTSTFGAAGAFETGDAASSSSSSSPGGTSKGVIIGAVVGSVLGFLLLVLLVVLAFCLLRRRKRRIASHEATAYEHGTSNSFTSPEMAMSPSGPEAGAGAALLSRNQAQSSLAHSNDSGYLMASRSSDTSDKVSIAQAMAAANSAPSGNDIQTSQTRFHGYDAAGSGAGMAGLAASTIHSQSQQQQILPPSHETGMSPQQTRLSSDLQGPMGAGAYTRTAANNSQISHAPRPAAISSTGVGNSRGTGTFFGRNRKSSDLSGLQSGAAGPAVGARHEEGGSRFFSSGRSSRRQSASSPSKPIVSEDAPILPDMGHLGDFNPIFGSTKSRLGAAAPNKRQEPSPDTSNATPGMNTNESRDVERFTPSAKPTSTTIVTTSGPSYVSTTTTTINNHYGQSTQPPIHAIENPKGVHPEALSAALAKPSPSAAALRPQPDPDLAPPLTSRSPKRLSRNISENSLLSLQKAAESNSSQPPSNYRQNTSDETPTSVGPGARPTTPANQLDNQQLLTAGGNPGTTPPLSNFLFGFPGPNQEPRTRARNQSEPLSSRHAAHSRNLSNMSTTSGMSSMTHTSALSIPDSEPDAELGTASAVPVPRKSSKRASARYYYPPAHEAGGFDFQFEDIQRGPYGGMAKSEPNTAYQTARHSTDALDRSYDDSDVALASTSAAEGRGQGSVSPNQIRRKPVSATASRLLEIVNTPRRNREAFE